MSESSIVWILVALVLIAIAIGVSIALGRARQQRTARLHERFGPEYERTVRRYGTGAGERELAVRAARVEQLELRELSDDDRARFTSEWTNIQGQFVDDPRSAVSRANDLIKEVMRARGYSADTGFEQRAADLSVDHPEVVEHYRAARVLATKHHEEGTSTEELRQAVVHYRVLFGDLLEPARTAPPGTLEPAPA